MAQTLSCPLGNPSTPYPVLHPQTSKWPAGPATPDALLGFQRAPRPEQGKSRVKTCHAVCGAPSQPSSNPLSRTGVSKSCPTRRSSPRFCPLSQHLRPTCLIFSFSSSRAAPERKRRPLQPYHYWIPVLSYERLFHPPDLFLFFSLSLTHKHTHTHS